MGEIGGEIENAEVVVSEGEFEQMVSVLLVFFFLLIEGVVRNK